MELLQKCLVVAHRRNDARSGKGRGEGMRQFRHNHRGEGDEAAERKLAADLLVDLRGDRVEALSLLDQHFGFDEQAAARRRQRQSLRMMADEELSFEFPFQMRDRGRDRRLRYTQTLGGERDAARLGGCDKIYEISKRIAHVEQKTSLWNRPLGNQFSLTTCLQSGTAAGCERRRPFFRTSIASEPTRVASLGPHEST